MTFVYENIIMKGCWSTAAWKSCWSRSWVWKTLGRTSRQISNGRIIKVRERGWGRKHEVFWAILWSPLQRYPLHAPSLAKSLLFYSHICLFWNIYNYLFIAIPFSCYSCFYWNNAICFPTVVGNKCCILFLFCRVQKRRGAIRYC